MQQEYEINTEQVNKGNKKETLNALTLPGNILFLI